jgi:hypothetical protein
MVVGHNQVALVYNKHYREQQILVVFTYFEELFCVVSRYLVNCIADYILSQFNKSHCSCLWWKRVLFGAL